VIGASVGVDDKVGDDVRPGRLDEDVNLLGVGRPALGIADDPAHGVAGSNRAGADQLLALLQGDVGDLSGRGIDLVEGALGERKHLDGIHVTGAARLDSGGRVCEVDALARIARLRRRSCARQRLELARQGQRLRQLGRLEGRAAGQRRRHYQGES
jgi:hypothetical protein